MTDQLVLRHDEGGVATLTLNRPEKLNALNPSVFMELRAHLEALAADDTVGAVVLTGAGRSFCAGNDLGGIAEGVKAPSRHYQAETIDLLEALPKPTIAKVRGHCFTGGLELALGCDLIYSTVSAQFGDTHGQWGLAATWGMTVRLPERIGVARAKELMFTARRISGVDAMTYGLVNLAVPDDELDAVVGSVTAEIVAASWDTSRIDKAYLADHRGLSRADALAHERSGAHGQPRDRAERMGRRGK